MGDLDRYWEGRQQVGKTDERTAALTLLERLNGLKAAIAFLTRVDSERKRR